MKKAAIINSIKQATDIKDLVSAFIVPVEGLSSNYEVSFSIDDIKKLKSLDKEIFVSINKNIHNSELEFLESVLLEIEALNITGIIFYDIGVLNIKKRLSLKTPLVWAQEHLTTNYVTINYWQDKGCEYAYLSSEITKEEMDEIREKTSSKLFVLVFGHIPMFTSRRHLIDNYKNYFSLDSSKGRNTLHKEDKKYPIIDKKEGTSVFSDYILNATDLDFSSFDYTVYNSYLIDDNDFLSVLKGKNVFPYEHGFLYQETIYKVKRND